MWNLEFNANQPTEHDAVREGIAADLKRLTKVHPNGDAEWLAFLRQGYKLAGNSEAYRQEGSKLLTQYPQSKEARRLSDEQWSQQHQWSGSDPEKWKAYEQAGLQRANEKS